MSESKHRSDADAVLSSVRRIVTRQLDDEETEPAVSLAPEQAAPEPDAEKLILTPALRVNAADGAVQSAGDNVTPLEQRIAELERAVGATDGDWEPDGSEETDAETPDEFVFTSSARLSADPVETTNEGEHATALTSETQAENPPQGSAVATAASAQTELVDGGVIDEDALRDIVAEIVRTELQGELGERITRNIRKLVRREIHRAIMTRDFG